MPTLSQFYNYYTHDIFEYKRLIERERGMVDTIALVSIDEFFAKIVEPLLASQADPKNPFAKFFEADGREIENTLYYWASLEEVESANIKWEMMSEEVQNLIEKRYGDNANMSLSERLEVLATLESHADVAHKVIQDLMDIRDQIKANFLTEELFHQRSYLENKRYPALSLGNIIQAIDAVSGTENILLTIEKTSLFYGYGQEALDFWKSVNSLKDYSRFFPNKPKPRGDTRDDNDGRVKVGVFKPAFGS